MTAKEFKQLVKSQNYEAVLEHLKELGCDATTLENLSSQTSMMGLISMISVPTESESSSIPKNLLDKFDMMSKSMYHTIMALFFNQLLFNDRNDEGQ